MINSIFGSIDKPLSTYWQYRSGRVRKSGQKERKSDLPVAQPIRRSRRLNRDAPEYCDDTVDTVIVSTKAKITFNQVKNLSLNRCVYPFMEEWLKDVRTKLSDIISLERKRQYEKAVDDGKAPMSFIKTS